MGFSVARQDNLTANTKSANVFSGNVNEFVSDGGPVTFYAVASAAGIRATVYADQDIIIDDQEIPFIGITIAKDQHMLDVIEVGPQTRLSVFLRETAGVSTTDILVGVEVA